MDDKLVEQFNDGNFSIELVEKGIEKISINLNALYSAGEERAQFETRWNEFYQSDDSNQYVFFKEGDTLSYYSQSLVPNLQDSRTPLLLVFGNPAPHSVKEKAIFSFEGDGREHRVWKVLRETGVAILPDSSGASNLDKSHERKEILWSGRYESPFLLGFASYFSMPSTPSVEPWAGVNGLRRLFGSKALSQVEYFDQRRMERVIHHFMKDKRGIIVTFQKDAYISMRSDNSPEYDYTEARTKSLQGSYNGNDQIRLIATGPTRLIHSKTSKVFLRSLVDKS
ncbi:MAG: hypothetical protein KatS3mg085_623 [Candidatus Dojkabacteria bacterium]|nr:MAG: hypothetical protein KatS3mg085_623 [Candidatus Dojkabacteria bacterium]